MAKTADFTIVAKASAETLAELAQLKAEVAKLEAEQQKTQVREATVTAQVEELAKQLQALTGSFDWAELTITVAEAATKAQEAIQALTDALAEAGIDSE